MVLPLFTYAQSTYEYNPAYFAISSEVDVANVLQTGEGNGYDGTIKVSYRNEGFQMGLFVESFPNRDFLSYGAEIDKVINKTGRINYLVGVAISLINRTTERHTVYNAPSIAGNAQIGYNIGSKFYIFTRYEYRRRGDLKFLYDASGSDLWVSSGFIGISFKI